MCNQSCLQEFEDKIKMYREEISRLEFEKVQFLGERDAARMKITALLGELGHAVPDGVILPVLQEHELNVLAKFIAKERDYLRDRLAELAERSSK